MTERQQKRTYCLHGFHLDVTCSASVAETLESRFRLLPRDGEHKETILIDFQSVPDGGSHRIERPQGNGRIFYRMPKGEAVYFADNDQAYLSFQDGVRALGEPGRGRVSFSIVESEPLNLFTSSHLILTILLVEMLKRRECYSMHAAGFSKDGKALLIPGTSGAGKSTLAVMLLRSGFAYLSDDMTFLRRDSNGLEALGFPEDVDVSDRTIGFFPELDFLAHNPRTAGFPKKQVRADEVYGAELVQKARPGAIILPRISGKDASVVRPIGADEAMLEMVSNVLLTDATSCQKHLNFLTDLAQQTPCYRLETGLDFDRVPVLLQELLTAHCEEVHA